MSAFRFLIVLAVILALALGGAVPVLAQTYTAQVISGSALRAKEETKQKIFLSVIVSLIKKIIKESSD